MFFFRCFLTISCATAAISVVLEIPGYAKVKGREATSDFNHRRYFSFYNLPYAKPPTNSTRFLPPVPIEPFPANETIGVSRSPGCLQAFGSMIIGNENCLIVDVHTPKLPGNASDRNTKYNNLLPVIYWIHGGKFETGSNLLVFPSKYMSEDVVLVSVQYRLGPLGFLTMSTDEIPGNAGIFDQIEGLRWVKKYIKYFGGDPDCVTIVGESAGSASVSLLLLAPQASGLFHRAIGESGSVLAEWALTQNMESIEEPCKKFAEFTGCPIEPYEDLLYCLRNMPAKNLIKAYRQFKIEDMYNGGTGLNCNSPVIQFAGAQRIIEQSPRSLMESGNYSTDVPIMFGANKQEGFSMLGDIFSGFYQPHQYMNNSEYLKHEAVQQLLKTSKIDDDSGALADALISRYLSKAKLGDFESMLPGLVDLFGVIFIKSASYETVKLHSRNNPNSFWYSFEFEGRYTTCLITEGLPFHATVCHGDEMTYLLGYPFDFNVDEQLLSKRMLKLWTTFAKTGNPTPDDVPMHGIPKFQPYSFDNEYYMVINREWTTKQDYSKQYTVTVDSDKYSNFTTR